MKYTYAIKQFKEWTLIKKSATNLWIVKESFTWYIDYENKKWEVTVPEWFEFDFWSIPRWLRWLFNPTKYLAYLLHDYLYNNLQKRKDKPITYNYERRIADDILYEALKVEGMIFIWRYIIWKAVHLFGWIYQKNLRKKEGII